MRSVRVYLGLFLALLVSTATAQVPLNIQSGGSNHSSMIRGVPTYVNARVLAANTAESVTVPSGARFVLFASTCNFYAHPTTTATVPAADVTNGTASELSPAAWLLSSNITAISVIADATCVVTLSFYR